MREINFVLHQTLNVENEERKKQKNYFVNLSGFRFPRVGGWKKIPAISHERTHLKRFRRSSNKYSSHRNSFIICYHKYCVWVIRRNLFRSPNPNSSPDGTIPEPFSFHWKFSVYSRIVRRKRRWMFHCATSFFTSLEKQGWMNEYNEMRVETNMTLGRIKVAAHVRCN